MANPSLVKLGDCNRIGPTRALCALVMNAATHTEIGAVTLLAPWCPDLVLRQPRNWPQRGLQHMLLRTRLITNLHCLVGDSTFRGRPTLRMARLT